MIISEATSAAPAEGEPTMKTGLWLLYPPPTLQFLPSMRVVA